MERAHGLMHIRRRPITCMYHTTFPLFSETFHSYPSRFDPQVINCTIHTMGFGSPSEKMSMATTQDVNTLVCKRTLRILYLGILLDILRAIVHFSERLTSNFGDPKI